MHYGVGTTAVDLLMKFFVYIKHSGVSSHHLCPE